MPVRNAARFLGRAIDSIRCQSFGDFELLLIDDGSTDESPALLARHAEADPRLRVVTGAAAGVAAALNHGIEAARAPLIARMDADDEAEPERLARQVDFLAGKPDLALVGSGFHFIDAEGNVGGSYVPTTAPALIRDGLLLGNRIAHPTVMMRRAAVLAVGGYRPIFTACEDYDLWLRLSEHYDLANLPDLLLRYRHHGDQVSGRNISAMLLQSVAARHAARARRAGKPDPLEEVTEIDAAALARIRVPAAAITVALQGGQDPALEQENPRRLGPVRSLLRDMLQRMRERDGVVPGAARAMRLRPDGDGRGRIFVMMPAYRDSEAQWTIRDAFAKAADPERISVGIVWQLHPTEDRHCMTTVTRPDQVRALCFDYREARGCSWARNQGMRLWEGEEYLLQIDSHMRFVPDWDRLMLEQLAACPAPKALLTCRPQHYDLPNKPGQDLFTVMTAANFDQTGVLVFGARAWPMAEAPTVPRLTAFCGGGFIFGLAARAIEVPFDPHVYFHGEEPNLAVRLWTHGWDFFCPNRPLIYHHYGGLGPGRRHSWNEVRRSQRLHRLTLQRMDHLLEVRRSYNPVALMDLHRYGLGRARSLSDYEAFAGVCFRQRRIEKRAFDGLFEPLLPETLAG